MENGVIRIIPFISNIVYIHVHVSVCALGRYILK